MLPLSALPVLIPDSLPVQRNLFHAGVIRTNNAPLGTWLIKNFLAKFVFILFTAFAALATPLPASAAAGIDLSVAGQYDLFVVGDFTGVVSTTKGRLAVGGDAVIDGCFIAQALDPATAGDALVTGGDLSMTDSTVYRGDVRVGGSAAGTDASNFLAGELTEYSAVPVDFAVEAQYLLDLSANLAAEPANGTYEYYTWGKIRLTGDGVSGLQVFNLNGAEVSNSEIFELGGNIPPDATLILNVSGTSAGLTNAYMGTLDTFSSRILFNFHEAVSLNVSNIQVKGSILAPLAHIEAVGSTIFGNVVAGSWNGDDVAQNHNPFVPYMPVSVEIIGGQAVVTGVPDSCPPNSPVTVVNTQETVTVTSAGDGGFTAQIPAASGDTLSVRCCGN